MHNEFAQQQTFARGRGSADAQHQADQALFHELLERHNELERQSVCTHNGIEATTRVISGDQRLIGVLVDHALGMKKRFDGGRAIRSWDRLFVDLFDYRHEVQMDYEVLADGFAVRLTSQNPRVVELLHCHNQTLHNFVNQGFVAARESSPHPDDV